MLFTNPNMTIDDAMKAKEFTKREVKRHNIRKIVMANFNKSI